MGDLAESGGGEYGVAVRGLIVSGFLLVCDGVETSDSWCEWGNREDEVMVWSSRSKEGNSIWATSVELLSNESSEKLSSCEGAGLGENFDRDGPAFIRKADTGGSSSVGLCRGMEC